MNSGPTNYNVDPLSHASAELDVLFNQVPLHTDLGSAVLKEEFSHGTTSPRIVRTNQLAIACLDSCTSFRDDLNSALGAFAHHEKKLDEFIEGKDTGFVAYQAGRKGGQALRTIQEALEDHKTSIDPESGLELARKHLATYNESHASELLVGPVYITLRGLRGKHERNLFEPRWRHRSLLSGRIVTPSLAALYLAQTGHLPPGTATLTSAGAALVLFTGLYTHMPMGNRSLSTAKDDLYNNPIVYRKIRKEHMGNGAFMGALMSVGLLDKVQGLAAWQQQVRENGHKTCFPDVTDSNEQHIDAWDMKNPVLAGSRADLVENTIHLGAHSGQNLTFLTGPNSGGKSTLSKALIQNQILAQIGAPVVATRFGTNIADTIAYHIPLPPDLSEQSGRFGFELQRVRSILNAASPASLTILDDCLDGTTHEERLEVLQAVMAEFAYTAGNTVFSTHAHELVDDFANHELGQFLQVEFSGKGPTYRVIPGISHTSHAREVAERYGFDRRQVAERIRKTGKTPPDWL